MTAVKRLPFLLISLLSFTPAAMAQRHELGLTLGALLSQERGSGSSRIELGSGTALQANYARRLWENDKAALLGEVHLLANPQRVVASDSRLASRDVATLYITPGIRVRFAPKAGVRPYVAIGGGYALYEHSRLRIDGRPNDAPRHRSGGAFDVGGGVDVDLWRWLGLRGEIRDFFTGSPAYNVDGIGGGQHNLVAGGGFVIRWGE
jgi:hypothetical protein